MSAPAPIAATARQARRTPGRFTVLVLGVLVGTIGEKTWGRSPGKLLLRCRVVSARGGALTWGQALMRNMVRYFCPPLGMAWMLQPPAIQTGLAGTVVVIDLALEEPPRPDDGAPPGSGERR